MRDGKKEGGREGGRKEARKEGRREREGREIYLISPNFKGKFAAQSSDSSS